MAVQDGDERLQFAGTEPCFESLDRLRRERNFRHEHNRALALFERVRDGLQVNFGFAGTGDAVQKERAAGILPADLISRSAAKDGFKVETSFPQPKTSFVEPCFCRIFPDVTAILLVLRRAAHEMVEIFLAPEISNSSEKCIGPLCRK